MANSRPLTVVTLESTETAQINAELKVGVVSSSVVVSTDAPILELEKPAVGTNMNGKVVTELPLSSTTGPVD